MVVMKARIGPSCCFNKIATYYKQVIMDNNQIWLTIGPMQAFISLH